MATSNQAKRSYRAKYNLVKIDLNKMLNMMDVQPEFLTKEQMSFLRDTASAIAQNFHEFNAYRNAATWQKAQPND